MSRRPLLRLNSKEPKHTLVFITEEDGCRIPQRVRTSSTSSSMHQHMDTFDGLERTRRISVEAAARYAHTAPVHGGTVHHTHTAPVHGTTSRHANTLPAHGHSNHVRIQPVSLTDQPPPPPLPLRTSQGSRTAPLPPRPAREPRTTRLSPHRDPPTPRGIITLDQVRPGPRAQNDYVDSPQFAAIQQLQNNSHKTASQQSSHSHHGGVAKSVQNPGSVVERTVNFQPSGGPGGGGNGDGSRDLMQVITAQPQPSSGGLKKPGPSVEDSTGNAPCSESLICSQCKKCRCQACTQPRELPRRWLCSKKRECSVQKLVDVCSCLCCVSACFYHCFKDSEGDEFSASDDPCACCERPHCCKRWACLGMMSLCLPCLCLYWPLRWGLSCCTSVYNKCTLRGCQCRRDKLPGSKRLLIDSESSST